MKEISFDLQGEQHDQGEPLVDALTGIYNNETAEKEVERLLSDHGVGILLLVNLDDLKEINAQYGHLFGDEVLRESVKTLQSMFLRNDILARAGGAQFTVFISIRQDEAFIRRRAAQIKEQLKEMEVDRCKLQLTATVTGAIYREKDSYQSLLLRAKELLAAEKQEKKKKKKAQEYAIKMDEVRIRAELEETGATDGAYFLRYGTFKELYRFIKRRRQRFDSSALIFLLTLTSGEYQILPIAENKKQMLHLREVIQKCLRTGDVFCQYSSCQYLVLLADIHEKDSGAVVSRITETFYEQYGGNPGEILLRYCYPLS